MSVCSHFGKYFIANQNSDFCGW